jgi:branched-chain amino acid transport system substrate-binding protein
VFRIGAILPLTGRLAWLGTNEQDGLRLAVEHVNAQAVRTDATRFQVLYGDSKGDPKEAVALANRFVTIDKVNCLIVSGTAMVNAVLPIANERDVLMFGITLHPGITKKSKNLFRIYVSDDQEWKLLAGYINKSGIKAIGIFHINAEYGIDSRKVLEARLNPDIRTVYAEPYEIGQSDFRSILAKVKDKKVDAIVLMGYGSEYVPLLRQMKEMGIQAKILGNLDFVYDFVRKEKTAQGAIFTAPAFSFGESGPLGKRFIETFRARFGREPSWDEAYCYDNILFLAEALRRARSFSTDDVKAALLGVREFQGASGKIIIQDNRDALTAMSLATLKNGSVVKIRD